MKTNQVLRREDEHSSKWMVAGKTAAVRVAIKVSDSGIPLLSDSMTHQTDRKRGGESEWIKRQTRGGIIGVGDS